MNVSSRTTGWLSDDRAAQLVISPTSPYAGEPELAIVCAGDVVRLFAMIRCNPLVPTIGGHKASVPRERPLKESTGGHSLGFGIDRLRRAISGPLRPVAPPKQIQLGRCFWIRKKHRRDARSRSNIEAPGRREDLFQQRQDYPKLVETGHVIDVVTSAHEQSIAHTSFRLVAPQGALV